MSKYNINSEDVVNKRSNIRQLVDILQVDIASKDTDTPPNEQSTRKKYEVFVTGGTDLYPVTSSLFHTVFDQDYTLQTSNEMLDFTVGLYYSGSIVSGALDRSVETDGIDASGKYLFANDTMMMREKINLYKQYAQNLLGDSTKKFTAPYESTTAADTIDAALFINIKRLFTRDGLDKEQLSFQLHVTGAAATIADPANPGDDPTDVFNIDAVASTDLVLFSDTGAKSSLRITTTGGSIGEVKNTDDDSVVGLAFYDKGVIVLDVEKVFSGGQIIVGSISAVDSGSGTLSDTFNTGSSEILFSGSLIPDFFVSASVDNILDHVCGTRFGRGNSTAIGLINQTSINSSIYFCRVGPNDANFSTNPTYVDVDGNIRCIQERGDDPFAYVTTVGLYNEAGDLVAVAKTSRPIEKNPEVDLSISVRIDY